MGDISQDKIKELRRKNWEWKAIGVYFGITGSRAHQIANGYKKTILTIKTTPSTIELEVISSKT